LPFFVFGVSRVFLPCFGLSPCLPCRGRSYLLYGLAWQAVAGWLSRCLRDRARVCRFGVSRIGGGLPSSACRCCRFCRFVSGLPNIGGGCSHPVAVCVFRRFKLSRFRAVCVGGRLSGSRTDFRKKTQGRSNKCSKQVFDSVSGSVCQNFQPNLGNFQPNPQIFQPNPDRIFTFCL
jgi:hypothetical protein